jgi:hypothetical protein
MVTYGWSFNFDLPEFIIFGDATMIGGWNRIYNELIEATNAPMVVDDFHR